jgi:transcriptional regulator with XRE-family HTH domain
VPSFDLPGTLRRIRRLADLSQRQLAAPCGLSQSAVAQAESGRRDLPVGALTRAAEQAGLRLALLDAAGHEVAGMSPDAVRDLCGRRFPAHLDTHFADEREGRYEHRYDRRRPWFTVDVDRAARDALRRRLGTPVDHHPARPGDSPQERRARRQEAARQRREEARRSRLAWVQPRLPDEFTCRCPPTCDELDDGNGRPLHSPN